MNHIRSSVTQSSHQAHESAGHAGHAGHSGHRWMMIACCIPMLAIAVALVVTGAASPGFILVAVACTAMMALMHGGMGHGGHDAKTDQADARTAAQGGTDQAPSPTQITEGRPGQGSLHGDPHHEGH